MFVENGENCHCHSATGFGQQFGEEQYTGVYLLIYHKTTFNVAWLISLYLSTYGRQLAVKFSYMLLEWWIDEVIIYEPKSMTTVCMRQMNTRMCFSSS